MNKSHEILYNDIVKRLYTDVSDAYNSGIQYCELSTILECLFNKVDNLAQKELDCARNNLIENLKNQMQSEETNE